MSGEGGSQVGSGVQSDEVPAWVRDNLVLKYLDNKGLKLEVMYDRQYLEGVRDKPLIVIRRKR
jgi:hypothetical protein